MKLAPLLLINVLLIAGALYIYDSLRTPARPAQTEAVENDDLLQADDLAIGGDREPAPAPVMLDGGGNETQVMALYARMESFEADLVRMRRALAARAARGGYGATGMGGGGASVAPIDLADVGDLEDPTFDERALGSIEAYMEEITRRKAVERQRNVVDAQLTRLGIELSTQQREGVIAETLAYQQRAAAVNKGAWPKDEAGRDQRRATFKALHAEYETNINSLVPGDVAEKITSSRLARTRGFSSGSGGRLRGGRDTGRNRNDGR